jgi:hypothetical protein
VLAGLSITKASESITRGVYSMLLATASVRIADAAQRLALRRARGGLSGWIAAIPLAGTQVRRHDGSASATERASLKGKPVSTKKNHRFQSDPARIGQRRVVPICANRYLDRLRSCPRNALLVIRDARLWWRLKRSFPCL